MAQAHGENLKQAMDTLRSHKLRSSLTVFGVVLGVSVICSPASFHLPLWPASLSMATTK